MGDFYLSGYDHSAEQYQCDQADLARKEWEGELTADDKAKLEKLRGVAVWRCCRCKDLCFLNVDGIELSQCCGTAAYRVDE